MLVRLVPTCGRNKEIDKRLLLVNPQQSLPSTLHRDQNPNRPLSKGSAEAEWNRRLKVLPGTCPPRCGRSTTVLRGTRLVSGQPAGSLGTGDNSPSPLALLALLPSPLNLSRVCVGGALATSST
ncbi:retinal rod rhodopsin-sensitive cGMP 3',5'-cyclic phosphodiesterase subunit gamma isoform X1 [Elephas maximus indicus]|uniref:retinal rod rhodopsin-sensitive cGMP 3',5'-cyclic phosphodiesterase subunit gamma isoform X1 n=1 Tax=Elephas maximus indicus TaxID=99487 RepID=UPI00211688B6|nr:retinal rod rhodopsin-sensitive cGMP 3',5'-cyclic phosphodiesterase subunit gamma isoform X1 [Elephas maximus indicus]